MSGYLGRLLRAAVRSERRLHPMAGSIYGERDAAPESTFATDLGEPYGIAEDQHSAGSERAVASPGPTAPITTRQAAEPMAFFEQYEPLQPPRRRHEAYTPHAAELSSSTRSDRAASHEHDPDRAMATSREGFERNNGDGDAAQVRRGATLRETQSHATGVRADGDAGERFSTSARDRDPTQTQNERISQSAAPEHQGRSASRRENWPRREGTPQTRTNEPQAEVHIGRIEVLAVQPPAPASAPRRERTTTLADYLAGRSGRAR